MYLRNGESLVPHEFLKQSSEQSRQGLFTSKEPDGTITLTAVAWDAVVRVSHPRFEGIAQGTGRLADSRGLPRWHGHLARFRRPALARRQWHSVAAQALCYKFTDPGEMPCTRCRVRRLMKSLVLATLATAAISLGGLRQLLSPAADAGPSAIRHIDLVHLSHTDVGFTDHPIVCRELQKRYLDIAIDAALGHPQKRPEAARFCWTAESTMGVNDWWRSATPERRADFLKAIDSEPTGRCGDGHE